MKPTLKALVMTVVFASVSFAGGSGLFAGQKMQAILNNTEIGRELSAGELLQQFRSERQRLLRQKAKDKQPHLIKNKIKILDGKISFLESQLKYTRPAEKPAPAPVAAKPAPLPSQPVAVKPLRVPVSVSWRPYAKPEPRRRIFIAKVQEKVVEKPVPAPVSVKMVPASAPSARENVVMHSVPQKAAPISAPASPAPASAPRGIKTGSDWKTMTAADKDIYALSVMGNLGRRDVFLEKSYEFYVREIDRRLENDPSLAAEYVYKILITTAYESEPEVRQDIDKIGK